MSRLVFLLEERSMKALLDGLLPRLMPGLPFLCVPHEGKQDLEKSVPRKLRAWHEPNVRFVVIRDNDGDEVSRSSVYLGLFGNEYGWEDNDGLSPTEREFNAATRESKRRLILIRGREDKDRAPKMRALIRRSGDELVRRRFEDTDELLRLVYGNERQRKGVAILRSEGRLTSGRYQEETGASRQTASRDLDEMVNKGVLLRHGERKGTFYTKANDMPQL